MNDVHRFAGLLAVVCAVVAVAVASSRLTHWLRLPAPALFLVTAAVASEVWPQLGRVSIEQVQRIVTVALVITFTLLIVGRRLERWLHLTLGGEDEPARPSEAAAPPATAPPS